MYNESLLMKSYQFFKICQRFDKDREKTSMQQSMIKEKLGFGWVWFYNRLFCKFL